MKRVCLLTGATGRLGIAFCQRFAGEYHIVGIHRRDVHAVPSRQHETIIDPLTLRRSDDLRGVGVFFVQADLTFDTELHRVVELALARYDRIDFLINAATTFGGKGLVAEDSADDLQDVINLNLLVPLKLSALVARKFWLRRKAENAAERRHVLNVSSIAAFSACSEYELRTYSVAKAGLNQLTRHMALEYATFGVRVNGVAPTSFPRLISALSVAETIVQVDRGKATGSIIVVDERGPREWRHDGSLSSPSST